MAQHGWKCHLRPLICGDGHRDDDEEEEESSWVL
jgi:hypothetical protein